jgi:excisionase family DNA binding protein
MSTPRTDLPADLSGDRILSVAQAAQLRGVSVSTFLRLVRAGKLPGAIQLSERRRGWRARGIIEAPSVGDSAA